MSSVGNQPLSLYVEGKITTIKWTTFKIGDHAILKFAGIDKNIEWEVTWIWNHTIYLNWEMIQLNNCIWAEKFTLTVWKEKLEEIRKTNFEEWVINELIQNSSQLVLEILLKHIENQIEISELEFKKSEKLKVLEIPNLDNHSNSLKHIDYQLNMLEETKKLLLLSKIVKEKIGIILN